MHDIQEGSYGAATAQRSEELLWKGGWGCGESEKWRLRGMRLLDALSALRGVYGEQEGSYGAAAAQRSELLQWEGGWDGGSKRLWLCGTKSASALVSLKVLEKLLDMLWLGSLQSKTACSAAAVVSLTGDFEGVVGVGVVSTLVGFEDLARLTLRRRHLP